MEICINRIRINYILRVVDSYISANYYYVVMIIIIVIIVNAIYKLFAILTMEIYCYSYTQ